MMILFKLQLKVLKEILEEEKVQFELLKRFYQKLNILNLQIIIILKMQLLVT